MHPQSTGKLRSEGQDQSQSSGHVNSTQGKMARVEKEYIMLNKYVLLSVIMTLSSPNWVRLDYLG